MSHIGWNGLRETGCRGWLNPVRRDRSPFFIFPWLLIFLAACRGPQATPYRPPTPAEPVAAASGPTAALAVQTQPTARPRTSSAPRCAPGLTYLEDLTIPDGSVVEPGQALDKRWQVENSGTCNWDQNYRLKLVSGPDLGAPAEQSLFPARSKTEAVIRVLFTAPAESGAYISAWQAHDPSGKPFGDPIYIQIVVP